MKLEEYLIEIENFLKEYLESSHMKAYVLGLSGGVDSSLVAAIARKAVGKDKLFCYSLHQVGTRLLSPQRFLRKKNTDQCPPTCQFQLE